MSSGYGVAHWPGTQLIKSWRAIGSEEELLPDEFFWPWEDGQPPQAVDDPALAEAAEFAVLNAKQRQANLQVTAIQGRVDSINDAIEMDEALPEEIAELPVRSAQLTTWKRYRITLGRVTTIAGWYQTPTYPTTPEPYTAEMSKA